MTIKLLKGQYIMLVQSILRQIENRMRDKCITLLALPKGYNEQKAFIVHIEHGGADAIEYISLGPRPGELVIHGNSSTAYRYSDYDSQDFYVIADPLMLLTLANATIDQFTTPCLPKSGKREDLVAAIRDYIGPEGNCPFEHGFPYPAHPLGKITEVRGNAIVVISRSDVKLTSQIPPYRRLLSTKPKKKTFLPF